MSGEIQRWTMRFEPRIYGPWEASSSEATEITLPAQPTAQQAIDVCEAALRARGWEPRDAHGPLSADRWNWIPHYSQTGLLLLSHWGFTSAAVQGRYVPDEVR